MRWRAFVTAKLQLDPVVGPLVGYDPATGRSRIEPIRLEQIDFDSFIVPAITYERVTTRFNHTLSGPSRLVMPRVQINCWASDPDSAEALADAVIKCLNGFRGQHSGANIGAALVDNDMDAFEQEIGLNRRIVDVILHTTEEVA